MESQGSERSNRSRSGKWPALLVAALAIGLGIGFGAGWVAKPVETTAQAELPLFEDQVPTGYQNTFPVVVGGTTYTFPALPGHYYKVVGNRIYGFHFQAGPPDGTWKWSSDAADGVLLYVTTGILGNCTDGYADPQYASLKANGYVHFHQLIGSTGMQVGFWLTHTAVTEFTFQGPPGNPHGGELVRPGVDTLFPNICEGP